MYKTSYVAYQEKVNDKWKAFSNKYILDAEGNDQYTSIQKLKQAVSDTRVPLIKRTSQIDIPDLLEEVAFGTFNFER